MSFKKYLQETAMGGSIGAGSIAANPSGDSRREHKSSEHVWRANAPKEKADEEKYSKMRAELDRVKAKKKKTGFKAWLLRRRTNEDFDMNDIVSRLKNADTESSGNDVGVVSYGVEDDKGNIMRITVRGDQAKEFEETIAVQLADNKDNKKNGINLQGNSLAEILYNLRDKFEIITVDFPIIPKDVVYNADMASKEPDTGVSPDDDDTAGFDKSFDQFGDGSDEMDGDAGGMGDNNSLEQPNMDANSTPMDDQGADIGGMGEPNTQGQESGVQGAADELNPGMGDENGEGDNVEDFGTEPEGDGEESILKSIVAMLKAQANAQEAQAEAAAEEARAKQAEWSAIASDHEVKRQEELARVGAEVEAQKKKAKEAKKYAELARYNVSKGQNGGDSAFESKSFLLDAVKMLNEDQFDNVQTLQKQKLQLQDKYKIVPTDDAETQAYKKAMFQCDTDQLNARIKAAQLTTQYNADEAKHQQNPQQNNQNPQNPQNPQPPQNPQNPTGQPAPGAPNGQAAVNNGLN
jgi:hypothetical protein